MIPAHPGTYAVYGKEEDPDQSHMKKPVVAFDEDGYALVVPEYEKRHSHLIRADSYSDFIGLRDFGDNTYPNVIPAIGWRVRWLTDGKQTSDTPLVGWALSDSCFGVPLASDEDGYVTDLTSLPNDAYELYHPDEIIGPGDVEQEGG